MIERFELFRKASDGAVVALVLPAADIRPRARLVVRVRKLRADDLHSQPAKPVQAREGERERPPNPCVSLLLLFPFS